MGLVVEKDCTREKISANQCLDDLDLPVEVARIVRRAWRANNVDGKTEVIRSKLKNQSDPFEYINESSDQADGQEVQNTTTNNGDNQTNVDHNQLSCSADEYESTNAYNTMSADGQGHGAESISCTMLLGDASRSDTLQKFMESVQNDRVISDQEWLEAFGITELQLRNILEPVAENILELFCFLNTGKLLSEHTSIQELEKVFPNDVVDSMSKKEKPLHLSSFWR